MPSPAIPSDRDGFRAVYDAHRDRIHRLLYRLCRNADDADDLLQETFTLLWLKRDQFRGEGSLAGYLRQIAYRTYLNARPRLLRIRAVHVLNGEPEGDAATPLDQAANHDVQRTQLDRIRTLVGTLPPSWREPFVLFRYEGLSCSEVAETMRLTPKTVEMRLARATRYLVGRLAELREGFHRPLPAL